MPSPGNCPVCESGKTRPFLEIPNTPVFCNQICKSREEALAAPLASIELSFCGSCGHVFNSAFAPEKMDYNPGYENSLHFSPRFQAYADDLAAGLIRRYGLRDKLILEIGCGRGDFLKTLCSMAPNRGLGFDPSHEASRDPDPGQGRVTILPEGFSEAHASPEAALICCRHCLEHIARPVPFLEMVRRAAGGTAATPVFFEVPNVLYTLRDGGIWDILYEHCGSFSPAS
ncbi:MAG: class I SAM-dependent methyltransferase, partial [Planctomycetota bacterium]